MAYESVLVHSAVPQETTEAGAAWTQGEPDSRTVPGIPFKCALFLPLTGQEDTPRGRRVVRKPTLLMAPNDIDGNAVALSPADELLITAEELTGPDPIRWQVDATPQPFGRPGDPIIGSQTTLARVED